jgi:choline dehydrogenase-like flavoprotein
VALVDGAGPAATPLRGLGSELAARSKQAAGPLVFEGSATARGALMNTTDVENYPRFPDRIMGPELLGNLRKAERFGAELVTDDVTEMDLLGDPRSCRWARRRTAHAGAATEQRFLEAVGAGTTFRVDNTAHLMGACRMGSDPSSSVVDRDCRSWDVPGLYVCDGSVFVTSSASNPSLTIQAIAARTADGLIAAGRRREL